MPSGRVILASLSDSEKFYLAYVEAEKVRPGLGLIAQNIYLMCYPKLDDFGRFPLDTFRIARKILNGPTVTPDDCMVAIEAMDRAGLVKILRNDHDAAFECWQFYEKAAQAIRKRRRPQCLPSIPSPEPAEKWGNWPADLATEYATNPGVSWQGGDNGDVSRKVPESPGNSRREEGRGQDSTGEDLTPKEKSTANAAPPKKKRKTAKKKPATEKPPKDWRECPDKQYTAQHVIGMWKDACKHKKRPCPPITKKEAGNAKHIAGMISGGELTSDALTHCMIYMLDDRDKWIMDKGHTLTTLYGEIGKYSTMYSIEMQNAEMERRAEERAAEERRQIEETKGA